MEKSLDSEKISWNELLDSALKTYKAYCDFIESKEKLKSNGSFDDFKNKMHDFERLEKVCEKDFNIYIDAKIDERLKNFVDNE